MLFFVEVSFFKFVLKKVVTNNYVNYFYLFFYLLIILLYLQLIYLFYITTEIWAQKFMIGLQYEILFCLFLP
jgi:hypothetical protein